MALLSFLRPPGLQVGDGAPRRRTSTDLGAFNFGRHGKSRTTPTQLRGASVIKLQNMAVGYERLCGVKLTDGL